MTASKRVGALGALAITLAALAGTATAQTAPGAPPQGGPGATGPGGPGAGGPGGGMMDMRARGEAIMKAAVAASTTDPAKWDWPVSATEEVRQSIINGGYTPDELRNIFIVLVMQSGNRWPNTGMPPPPMRMNPNDSRPFGAPGTQPALGDNPLYAPDIKFGNRGFRGLEQVFGSNGYLMNSFTDRKNTVVYLIAKKDRLYYAFDFEARHTGKLFGFQGDGKTLKIRETATMTFKPDGRIASIDMIGDDLSLYLQAGGKLSFPKD